MGTHFAAGLRKASRIAALAAVAAGIVLVVVYRSEIDPAAIHHAISGSLLAPAIFLVVQIIASLLFIPRSVLGVAAGLLFGAVWGLLWAVIGATAGAAAGFAFVRWLGAGGALDTAPGIGKLIEKAEQGGWRAVAIVRLMPLPHGVANTALALTELSWRDYMLGSFLGMLPMTAVQVEVGAAGGAAIWGQGGWALACLLLALALAASFYVKHEMKK